MSAIATSDPRSTHHQLAAPVPTSTAVAVATAALPGPAVGAPAWRVMGLPPARSPPRPRPAAAAVAAHQAPRRAHGQPGRGGQVPLQLPAVPTRRPGSLAGAGLGGGAR